MKPRYFKMLVVIVSFIFPLACLAQSDAHNYVVKEVMQDAGGKDIFRNKTTNKYDDSTGFNAFCRWAALLLGIGVIIKSV